MIMNSSILTVPPLIVVRPEGAVSCGDGGDTGAWMTPKAIRQSCAFVIHDPYRELWKTYAPILSDNRYVLKTLNLSTVRQSSRYNPFAYIRGDFGVEKLASALMGGTKGLGKPGDIDFVVCETMLLNALISFIHREAPDREQAVWVLMEMLETMIAEDYQYGDVSTVDILFEQKGIDEPWHVAVSLYNRFKDAVGDCGQAMRIAESCIYRLSPFDTPEMYDFMSGDELGLDRLAFPKTALFVTDGCASRACKLLTPLMYSQLFDSIYKKRA
jgi:type IV secretion system protein VirD4